MDTKQPNESSGEMSQLWRAFAVWESTTTANVPNLVKAAGVGPGQRVLDVGTGTGVGAVTAARAGARVSAVDPTPELLAQARDNARIAGVEVDLHEAGAEKMPFADGEFDVVFSHFGHMFAPHAGRAAEEMLRVLKSAGRLAFTAWPPNEGLGAIFEEVAQHLPAPPAGVDDPEKWGDPEVVRERLGDRVRDLSFEYKVLLSPALSLSHFRLRMEQVGPGKRAAEALPPDLLARFRAGVEESLAPHFQDNLMHLRYLLVLATKK